MPFPKPQGVPPDETCERTEAGERPSPPHHSPHLCNQQKPASKLKIYLKEARKDLAGES